MLQHELGGSYGRHRRGLHLSVSMYSSTSTFIFFFTNLQVSYSYSYTKLFSNKKIKFQLFFGKKYLLIASADVDDYKMHDAMTADFMTHIWRRLD